MYLISECKVGLSYAVILIEYSAGKSILSLIIAKFVVLKFWYSLSVVKVILSKLRLPVDILSAPKSVNPAPFPINAVDCVVPFTSTLYVACGAVPIPTFPLNSVGL